MAEDIKPTEQDAESTETVLDLQQLDTEDAEVEGHSAALAGSCVSVISVVMEN
jgi:hypothetical protein